ncbi:methylated-DNA--[protein]-cysteine S-methyltransferase [Microbacterium sp. MPKO10]|uniref:methylated-DNA--[protein]-cysteine S-methyltransferase n=1 Tax=Microbacterium sp. MPKO10 TaxID=2989818 RepID=UPI00223611F6|nr:methylated-DNA--[protein]-cysteine S-methyltransferase [Microbacterium sp. MPKO10]MCW4456719.1 methylated-DNA--[protein]-cysteine S-methyltransferase [Microbacterium sp. MPKO10]
MTVLHSVVDSPIGALTLVGRPASGGANLTAVWMDVPRHAHGGDELGPRDDAAFAVAARQLDEYFAGERRRFDMELDPEGTEFEKSVWMLLRDIPYGQTRSYGDLATELGDPNLSRAVGTANGRNPLSIIVPCHRVIGADGSLTGYAGGLERKRFLLSLERDSSPATDRLF